MSNRDLVEVFRAKNGLQARRFADALEEVGIRTQIQGNSFNPVVDGSLVSEAALWWDAPRILVFSDEAERAKLLLVELEVQEMEQEERPKKQPGPPIEIACEECGKFSIYPEAQRGTVQECPHCGAWVDVEDHEGLDDDPDSQRGSGTTPDHRIQ